MLWPCYTALLPTISNIERLDYKLSAFRILHTIPHVHFAFRTLHSAFYFPHFTNTLNGLVAVALVGVVHR